MSDLVPEWLRWSHLVAVLMGAGATWLCLARWQKARLEKEWKRWDDGFVRRFATVEGIGRAKSPEDRIAVVEADWAALRMHKLSFLPVTSLLEALERPSAEPTPSPPPAWHAARIALAARGMEAAEGATAELVTFANPPAAAAWLRWLADGVRQLPPERRAGDVAGLVLGAQPGKCDALLAQAVLLARVGLCNDADRRLAACYFSAETAVRDLLLDHGFAVDRPHLPNAAADASSGFAAELHRGGALRFVGLPGERERVSAALQAGADPETLAISVARFGVRSADGLRRTTLLVGYNPAEWR